MSPASSGSSGSDVKCVAAPTSSTTATADPSSASPTAAAAARSVAARTVRGPGSTEVASAPKHWTCTTGGRRALASSVLGRGVDVEERLQPRVCRGELGVREQGGLVQRQHATPFEQRLRAERAAVEELGDARGQARAIGGGERLGMAPRHRQRHLERRVRPDLAHHAADESRMQQRQVDGADRRHRRAPGRGGQTRRDALQRPAAGHRVVHDLHARRQAGQRLPRGPHHEDGPVDRPGEHPHRSVQQCRPVPLQRCLGAAHPYRAAADEDDAGHEWATVGHPMVVRDCRGRQPVRAG